MIVSIIKKYDSLPQFWQILISSVFTTVPIYCSALLSVYIKKIFDTSYFVIHSIAIVILIVIFLFFINYFKITREKIEEDERIKNRVIHQAYSHCNRYVMENLIAFHERIEKYVLNSNDSALTQALIRSTDNIKSLVDKLYQCLESHFGNEENLQERVEFEVTFMTKSYRDNEITIPAYSNRDKRAPRSMIFRRDNPKIYDNTVTAIIYSQERPQLCIVENTEDDMNYKELYTNQKQRIKSSIICPVLSDQNELLGTLVVHCNKAYFFLNKDLLYWNELLEIFTKRIACEKFQLDIVCEKLINKQISISLDFPF